MVCIMSVHYGRVWSRYSGCVYLHALCVGTLCMGVGGYTCVFTHVMHVPMCAVHSVVLASFPGFSAWAEKRAWYTLIVHAQTFPLDSP